MHKKIFWILFLCLAMQCFPLFTEEKGDVYICPMECQNLQFHQPGACPVCGMDLVKKANFVRNERTQVAILIFEGVQIIDFSAPYEVFGQAHFDVVTVAEQKKPITTSMNLTVVPEHDFSSVPQPDILVVPGGDVDGPVNSAPTIQWIKKSSSGAKYVLSVCNGAFILAKSGLLDGLSATTFYRLIDQLAQEAPKTKVVRDKRFVDNGKIITTAGLTSGMDGSLHVISKILGKGQAQRTALHLEYNWEPEGKFARASLADMNIPNIEMPDGTRTKFLRTEGTANHWEMDLAITTDMNRQDLQNHIETHLIARSNWKELPSQGDPNVRNWSFSGKDGKPWKAVIRFENAKDEKNTYIIKVALDRA